MSGSGIIRHRFVLLITAAVGILAAGCNQEAVHLTRTIPEGASPIYKWHGERSSSLRTYWGDEAVSLTASAFFPDTWERPGDGYWEAEGRTGEGKPIPFIGTVLWYENEKGTRLSKIVPPVDVDVLKDWIYFVIDPNVTKEDGKITSIEPVAHLRQVRDHRISPWFNAEVRLFPEKPSALTPAPERLPEEPEGTPIAID